MKEIRLGRVLVGNRHKRGITQDELAAYLGAVSYTHLTLPTNSRV